MTTFLGAALILVSLIAIAVAVADTVRFTRRTGNQVPTHLAYRAYVA